MGFSAACWWFEPAAIEEKPGSAEPGCCYEIAENLKIAE
jgi:hypothetical protein